VTRTASNFTFVKIPSPYEGDHPSLWKTGYRVYDKNRTYLGIVFSHEHHSWTTYSGTRIRRDLGHPTRWKATEPRADGHRGPEVGYHFYSREEAAEALLDKMRGKR
jgi:hypothetical protein